MLNYKTWFSPRAVILAGAFCIVGVGAVKAQVDFSVNNVQILAEDADSFEICYEISHSNDSNGVTPPLAVPLRISIQGPSTTVNDDQVVTWNYPDDKHGDCKDGPACAPKACPKWTVIVAKGPNERVFRVLPLCRDSGGTCRCFVDDFVPPPKEDKPKHNGPGSYTVTVTIDNGNTVAETNEGNNSDSATTTGDTDQCPDIPAVSTWGALGLTLLVLAAGTVVLRRRMAPKLA